jgi:hypothetical protein
METIQLHPTGITKKKTVKRPLTAFDLAILNLGIKLTPVKKD